MTILRQHIFIFALNNKYMWIGMELAVLYAALFLMWYKQGQRRLVLFHLIIFMAAPASAAV